ncbi:platelet glycoprotein VI isoform X4 [Phocoena sinus]|uniref:platelet glycoprotein VI isoform X4 n=1 Tax=Phocoena sinus TaxID=42100 RepID=UPI0013C50DD1|nr:platelet glycoprotein VI isoform X4 [Phocoena sinus]
MITAPAQTWTSRKKINMMSQWISRLRRTDKWTCIPHPGLPSWAIQLRTGRGTMSPTMAAAFCLGLCLGQVIQAQKGLLPKPSLQARPSSLVPLGKPVTISCQGPPGADLYRLEELISRKYLDQAELSISAMEQRFVGRYRCSYQSGTSWSPPSNQLELVATGTSFTPSWLPTEPPSSVTEFSEASKKLNHSLVNEVATAETSRNITILPKESDPPTGLAFQYYTKSNLVRICLGAVILILLVGLLAEDWHSRKKPLMHRVRAVHRPLPPLPQTQKSHSCQDGGRPDDRN